MSSRAAARGKAAANSIRLTSRTSEAVATSRASPSRCFLFRRGSRAARSAPIVVATITGVPAKPGLLHAGGPVRRVELGPLALELGSGLPLIPDAALVGVAILRAERLCFTTRRLDVKTRELLSNADARGQHQQGRCREGLEHGFLH